MAFDEKTGKTEKTKPLHSGEKPIHIDVHLTPKETKLSPTDSPLVIEPKRVTKVSPKGTREKREEKTVVHPGPAKAQTGISSKTEAKSYSCSKLLFILSLTFMALALGLFLLPLLNISIPPFLTSVIDLITPI